MSNPIFLSRALKHEISFLIWVVFSQLYICLWRLLFANCGQGLQSILRKTGSLSLFSTTVFTQPWFKIKQTLYLHTASVSTGFSIDSVWKYVFKSSDMVTRSEYLLSFIYPFPKRYQNQEIHNNHFTNFVTYLLYISWPFCLKKRCLWKKQYNTGNNF